MTELVVVGMTELVVVGMTELVTAGPVRVGGDRLTPKPVILSEAEGSPSVGGRP